MNTSETEKIIIHQHYGTFNIPLPNRIGNEISPRLFTYMKTEKLLIKYTVLLLSLIVLTLDIKNIRHRITNQDDIVSEVNFIHLVKTNSYSDG